ncbi:MAG: hypothetical protein IT362_07210 [Deltaproteobacteria bacterium]|nr:hypothetical protein [Deltaproteobacteria bacterium]
MRRALLIINILLGTAAVAVAAFAAKEAVVLRYGGEEIRSRPLEVKTAAQARSLSEYASIPDGGLFGKGSLPSSGAGDQELSPSGLILVGTAEGMGYAIFMDTATGKQKAFKTGESVFGGGTLVSIGTRKAELSSGARKFSFAVPSSMPMAAQTGEPQAQSSQIASSRGDGRWVVDQRAVEGIFDNMDKVLTDARFTPYVEGGKLSGFQVSEIKTGGVFGLIGLQNGDVVLSINEYKLDSPGKVAQILGGLKGETEVKVDVLRGKQPRTLRYQIR